MASPLTLFLPIKQDAISQGGAALAVQTFTKDVQALLDETKIVHYATLVLVPNPDKKSGSQAILLMTDFDLAMTPYLQVFWNKPGIKEFVLTLQKIVLNPGPPITTFDEFVNFITDNNLSPQTGPTWNNFYEAYNKTVVQILGC